MVSPIILNRQQLAQFLPSPEAIRAFEQLFAVSQLQTPDSILDLLIQINAVQSQTIESLDRLSELVNNLYALLPQPEEKQDIYFPPVSIGSLGQQESNNVSITGGALTDVTVAASALSNAEAGQLVSSTVALTDLAGATVGTLNNSPTLGDPVKWIGINDNGTVRAIPTW